MPNLPISGLTASASNAAATDVLPVVQTTGTGPVKMTVQQMAGGLLGSTTLSGATITADAPVLNMSQTWNNGAVTFTGLKFNAATGSSAGSASGSLLMDLQLESASKFSVSKAGAVLASGGSLSAPGFSFKNETNTGFTWLGAGDVRLSLAGSGAYRFQADTFHIIPDASRLQLGTNVFLSRRDSHNLRLGNADAAAPVAQTLSVQSITGTNASAAAYPFKITGAQGTGNAAGGSIIFQVAPAGGSGAVQNTPVDALTIMPSGASRVVEINGATVNDFVRFTAGTNVSQAYFCTNSLGGKISLSGNDTVNSSLGNSGMVLSTTGFIGWSNNANLNSGIGCDLAIMRDDANKLALRNGANAQEFRVYHGYSDATNYSYGQITTASNVMRITPVKLGTGTLSDVYIYAATGGELRLGAGGYSNVGWAVSSSGHFLAGTDNLYDIGASGANRPRNVYVVGTVTTGTVIASIVRSSNFNTENNTHTVLTFTNSSDNLLFATGGTSPRINFCGTTSAFPALKRVSANLQVIAADGISSAGLIVGNQALATTATDGFLYVPTCPGTPTGTPTTQTGTVPIVVDTSANKLYFYSGAAWRDASV